MPSKGKGKPVSSKPKSAGSNAAKVKGGASNLGSEA
jgi:hypothetical protein